MQHVTRQSIPSLAGSPSGRPLPLGLVTLIDPVVSLVYQGEIISTLACGTQIVEYPSLLTRRCRTAGLIDVKLHFAPKRIGMILRVFGHFRVYLVGPYFSFITRRRLKLLYMLTVHVRTIPMSSVNLIFAWDPGFILARIRSYWSHVFSAVKLGEL